MHHGGAAGTSGHAPGSSQRLRRRELPQEGSPLREKEKLIQPSRGPRHSLHYYLALFALCGGSVDIVLTLWAYYDEGLTLTHVTFAVTIFTAVSLYATWFWGTFLAMNGTIPPRRLVYLIVHTLIGFMAPLIYTVSVTMELDFIGSQPLGDPQLTLSFWGLIVVLAQFVTGWSVLRRRPWRLMVRQGSPFRTGSPR